MAMKLAWDYRSKTAFAIVLLVVAIYVVANWLWGGKLTVNLDSGPAATKESVPKKVPQGRPRKIKGIIDITKLDSNDPTIHFDFFAATESMKYNCVDPCRNIFTPPGFVAAVVPTADPNATPAGSDAPQGPPVKTGPPPFPLRFYGYSITPNGIRKVFFTDPDGQDIFIGVEGDLINKRYKISKINKSSVELLDVINHISQNLPLISN